MKVLFFGSAAFGLATLAALRASSHTLLGVVTAPDRARGRSARPQPTAVKSYAETHKLPLYQPKDLRSEEFQQLLGTVGADVFVVVAFRILPKVVWAYPPMGSINLHAAWLPDFKGAAPIEWAIMSGAQHTGLTTFCIQQGIDTGGILLQKKEPIFETDTGGSLSARLAPKGAELVIETLNAYAKGAIRPRKQPACLHEVYAPKLNSANTQIQWHRPAEALMNFVRALDPKPGAWTHWNGQLCRIFELQKAPSMNLAPGQLRILNKKALFVGTQSKPLQIVTLQIEGKKRMNVQEFLCGYRGDIPPQLGN